MPEGSRSGPTPGEPDFALDRGEVPVEVATALARYAADPGRYAAALGAVQRSRLLIPVVEVAADTFAQHDHEHEHDHDHDHDHEHATTMAAVLVQRGDGRRGLLAFTGLEPLRRWKPEARPVPVSTRLAAESARREGATALVVDLAGPTTLVVEGEDLTALAEGWTLAVVGEQTAWIRPSTP